MVVVQVVVRVREVEKVEELAASRLEPRLAVPNVEWQQHELQLQMELHLQLQLIAGACRDGSCARPPAPTLPCSFQRKSLRRPRVAARGPARVGRASTA